LQVTSASVLTTMLVMCVCVCAEHPVPWQWSGQEMSFLPVVAIMPSKNISPPLPV